MGYGADLTAAVGVWWEAKRMAHWRARAEHSGAQRCVHFVTAVREKFKFFMRADATGGWGGGVLG